MYIVLIIILHFKEWYREIIVKWGNYICTHTNTCIYLYMYNTHMQICVLIYICITFLFTFPKMLNLLESMYGCFSRNLQWGKKKTVIFSWVKHAWEFIFGTHTHANVHTKPRSQTRNTLVVGALSCYSKWWSSCLGITW